MSDLVQISGVSKHYGTKKVIFDNLNLSLESGKIIGLLGPNGSGKTTLIKLLSGLLSPAAGSILIDGKPVGPESKAIVSYLPERTYFNESLKVKNLVNMFKDFYADFDDARAYEMMGLLNIDSDMTLKKLSKGNKEKVQLIMVMSRRAKLYLLDEPIAGVDPAARDYILQTILTNYDPSATILLSTHLIYDIEKILDEIIFIKNGEIVCHKAADELREERGMSIDEIFREVFRC
ncbi:MAG: ABC transporter ATP-binding protein [Clostridium sp.]|nr:ABC transporter ATP-binding protein [Clostridium sp.]MCM1397907.1 ABC transporter ATP-binding protein [Clostridium sp.]MCM1459145.1 ABC transporter ATP-binding protein [Bacteroides sp.]